MSYTASSPRLTPMSAAVLASPHGPASAAPWYAANCRAQNATSTRLSRAAAVEHVLSIVASAARKPYADTTAITATVTAKGKEEAIAVLILCSPFF
jgi:hypothetical protein